MTDSGVCTKADQTMNDGGKMLGIIGGMGPEATSILYQWIIERTPAASDQEHIPVMILSDTHMPDRTEAIKALHHQNPMPARDVCNRLLRDARILEHCGCTCYAISCNTAHYFADQIMGQVSIPLLHMPKLTAARLKEDGCRKAAILATDGTILSGVYSRELEALGIEPWIPSENIQALVMHLIYDEIKKGEPGDEGTFTRIGQATRDAGCDRAILGCTELSVYRANHALTDQFYIDAMEVLAVACVRACCDSAAPL